MSNNKYEIITVILGAIGNMLIITGVSFTKNNVGGFEDLGSLVALLYQFIVSMIALPFLIYGLRKQTRLLWFSRIVLIESAINAIGVVLIMSGIADEFDNLVMSIIAFIIVLQLIPFWLHLLIKRPTSS